VIKLNWLRKSFAALVICFFTTSQVNAAAEHTKITLAMNDMVRELQDSKLNSDDIFRKAVSSVQNASAAGATEEDFIQEMSKRFASILTPSEVQKAIDEIKTDHSPVKLMSMVNELKNASDSEPFLGVLIMFAIYSAIMVGVFLLITKSFPHLIEDFN